MNVFVHIITRAYVWNVSGSSISVHDDDDDDLVECDKAHTLELLR